MTIEQLDQRKELLLKEVEPLVKLKKKLYSNMDITSPMSTEEKDLNNKINSIFSEINSIILEKRKLKKV